MATTSPDNLRTPDPGDPYNLVSDLATLAGDVQDALNDRGNAFKGTAAERAIAESSVDEGSLWVDTDGIKMIWRKGVSVFEPAVWSWSGTTTQRTAFAAPDGFQWFDTTDSTQYVKLSGVWRPSGMRTAGGFENITVPVGSTSSTSVTFPSGLFSAPPGVALGNDLTYSANLVSYIRPTGVTSSGFTISAYKDSGSSSSARVGWVASGV